MEEDLKRLLYRQCVLPPYLVATHRGSLCCLPFHYLSLVIQKLVRVGRGREDVERRRSESNTLVLKGKTFFTERHLLSNGKGGEKVLGVFTVSNDIL